MITRPLRVRVLDEGPTVVRVGPVVTVKGLGSRRLIVDQQPPRRVNVAVGPQGPPGPPGAGLKIAGSVPTSADLPTLTADDTGTGYLADDTGDLWVWDGTAWLDAGPIRGPAGQDGSDGQDGADGAPGAAATVAVGTTTTGAPGTEASVVNSGTTGAAVLDFTIPQGATGATGSPGADGQDGADGVAATVAVGTTTTGAPGTDAAVTNSGTPDAAVLDFVIPRGSDGAPGADGADGAAATVAVGTTTTGAAGTDASVTNSGTPSAAVLDFTIPRGATGATGDPGPAGADGAAATIAVGTVTTGAPGSAAAVTNSGTSAAAVFDIAIPRGDVGATGPEGPGGPAWDQYRGLWGSGVTYAKNDVVNTGTSSWISLQNGNVGHLPTDSPAWWSVIAQQGPPGEQGPSGVVTVRAPLHNFGTATAADVGHNDQAAGTVLAGPSSGSAAAPGFRALVLSDLPAITQVIFASGASASTTGSSANSQLPGADVVITTTGGPLVVIAQLKSSVGQAGKRAGASIVLDGATFSAENRYTAAGVNYEQPLPLYYKTTPAAGTHHVYIYWRSVDAVAGSPLVTEQGWEILLLELKR